MTRYVVFRENTSPHPNLYVPLGSLTAPPSPIRIAWANAPEELPIGRAREFQRDETGAISFDIEMRPDMQDLELKEECFSVFARNLVTENDGERVICVSATISVLYFVPLPGFPPGSITISRTRDPIEFDKSKAAIAKAIRRQGLAARDEQIDAMAYKLAVDLKAELAWPE